MDRDLTLESFHVRQPFKDAQFLKQMHKEYFQATKAKSARDFRWAQLPRDQQGRDLNPAYYKPIKESPWEPIRPVMTSGHSYALTDEVRRLFPHSGLHLIPRATLRDLLVPEFTGYEDQREAEKWITQYSEWAIMYGLSAPLTKELLVDYLLRALKFVPKHPIPRKTFDSWEDFLRDYFLDMKIKKVENFKAWYWEKRMEVPIIWFSHTELKFATNFFNSSQVCGESATARLITAAMPNMTDAVVKRWKKVVPTSLGRVLKEIQVHGYLPKNHTPNLVHLVGYCTNREDPLLLYEFAPNGTLREHMKGKYGDYMWRVAPVRLSIAIDVATGVGELHYNGRLPVYHRDIKPSNILLDRSYRARISDFGDAVIIKSDDDRHCPAVCGSLGYLDPIYRATGRCDDKSDVYSLGVVLMELATGYKAWDPNRKKQQGWNPFLVGLVMDKVEKREIDEIIRPGDPYQVDSPHLMEGNALMVEMLRVAFWCCCPELHLRPRADEVASALLQIHQRWVDPAYRAVQQINEGVVDPTIPLELPVGAQEIPGKPRAGSFNASLNAQKPPDSKAKQNPKGKVDPKTPQQETPNKEQKASSNPQGKTSASKKPDPPPLAGGKPE